MVEQGEMLPIEPGQDPERLIGADLSDVPADKWEKSVVEAIEVGEAELVRRGLDQEAAFEQASAVVLAISQYRGGRLFYWPLELRRSLRRRRCRRWRDAPAAAVAKCKNG